MYEDVLNATVLCGVSGMIAVAFLSGTPAPVQTAKVQAAKVQANAAQTAKPNLEARAVMPIYDLPRVVVIGNRSRDGDLMAEAGAVVQVDTKVRRPWADR